MRRVSDSAALPEGLRGCFRGLRGSGIGKSGAFRSLRHRRKAKRGEAQRAHRCGKGKRGEKVFFMRKPQENRPKKLTRQLAAPYFLPETGFGGEGIGATEASLSGLAAV